MIHIFSQEEQTFNKNVNILGFLKQLGFKENSYYLDGETVRVFCPLHKDQIRRSLIIDKKTNTFKCQYDQCEGHKGGNLLEFYAMYMGIEPQDVMKELKKKPEKDQDKTLIQRADEFIVKGHLTKAIPLIQKALSFNPRNEINRCKLASLYLEVGKRDEGFKEYLSAAEDYAVKGDLDKTLGIYNILVMLSPMDLRVRKRLSYLFSRLGKQKEAVEHLKFVVDQLLHTGDTIEAIDVASRMTELQPDDPECYKFLGMCLICVKKFDKGMDHYERAARILLRKGDKTTAGALVNEAWEKYKFHDGINNLKKELEQEKKAEPEAAAPLGNGKDAPEGSFSDWLSDLEEEIEKIPTHDKQPQRPTTIEIMPEDLRVVMIKEQFESMDGKHLRMMRQQLVSMFATVRQNYEEGYIQDYEMRIIKEFYKSFCKALENHVKERGLSV